MIATWLANIRYFPPNSGGGQLGKAASACAPYSRRLLNSGSAPYGASCGPERSAEAVRRVLPGLLKLGRYERRAAALRDRSARIILDRKIRVNNQK